MKDLKKGSISLNVTGMVNVMAGNFPEIEINDKAIASYIADALMLDKKYREKVQFPGMVTLVIENFGEAEIKNTMTDMDTEPDHDVNILGGADDAM